MCSPQVFKPYNSPYTLPIPASARPSAVTTAPNLNYTDAGSGGVMALANAATNFALRFTGESCRAACCSLPLHLVGCIQVYLPKLVAAVYAVLRCSGPAGLARCTRGQPPHP